ncbi:MAG: S1 RNA-binding domain-containing protein [Lentisphaeria bacterium]|nr:S1 RNA-binding domain-containing protein [Lentisphaeria bacterium]NQZ68871.1 S1 RNA-binding domain-containing protein [Lentisphaeria bacterium]
MSEDFGKLLDQQMENIRSEFRYGEKIDGIVLSITTNSILVDIKAKSEGIISRTELNDKDGELPFKVGDAISAFYDDTINGEVILTTKIASGDADYSDLIQAMTNNVSVDGRVMGKNSAGFNIDIGGIRAFCPISQISNYPSDNPDEFVGKSMNFMVLECDDGNVVVSHRKVVDQSMEQEKEELKTGLSEGDVISGVVRKIMDFGAFVSIGGIDGLIPISELAWDRVKKTEDVVKEGETVKVKVIAIDWSKDRITLSLKQADGNPWDKVELNFMLGTKYQGFVTRLMDFGAFVQLQPGIEGLIHISKLGAGKRLNHADEVLEPGQEIDVYIDNIDKDRRRLSLLLENVQTGRTMEVGGKEITVGEECTGKIESIKQYGIFIKLNASQTGLLHVSQIKFDDQANQMRDMHKRFPIGEDIAVKVKEIHAGKISLGMPGNDDEKVDYSKMEKDNDSGSFGSLGGAFDNLKL